MPAAAPVTTMRRDIISSWTGGRADVSVVRGGGPAGATAEERPVAQRGAADVAVAVDARGGPAGGVQTRDRVAGPGEHLAGRRGVQATEGEPRDAIAVRPALPLAGVEA